MIDLNKEQSELPFTVTLTWRLNVPSGFMHSQVYLPLSSAVKPVRWRSTVSFPIINVNLESHSLTSPCRYSRQHCPPLFLCVLILHTISVITFCVSLEHMWVSYGVITGSPLDLFTRLSAISDNEIQTVKWNESYCDDFNPTTKYLRFHLRLNILWKLVSLHYLPTDFWSTWLLEKQSKAQFQYVHTHRDIFA